MGVFGGLAGWWEVLAVAGIALLSGIVHGYTGFGGALLMVPLLSFFMTPAHAIASTMIGAVIGQVSIARQVMPRANWEECRPFLAALIVGLPAGTYLLVVSDTDVIRRVVGASTLAAAALFATGWAYKGRRTAVASFVFGMVSGLLGGATGQGGPPAVAYFIASPQAADVQRASIIVVVTGLLLAGLFFLAVAGVVTGPVVALGALLSVPYMTGLWAGARLFSLLPRQNYRRGALILLVAAGLTALLK